MAVGVVVALECVYVHVGVVVGLECVRVHVCGCVAVHTAPTDPSIHPLYLAYVFIHASTD